MFPFNVRVLSWKSDIDTGLIGWRKIEIGVFFRSQMRTQFDVRAGIQMRDGIIDARPAR